MAPIAAHIRAAWLSPKPDLEFTGVKLAASFEVPIPSSRVGRFSPAATTEACAVGWLEAAATLTAGWPLPPPKASQMIPRAKIATTMLNVRRRLGLDTPRADTNSCLT